MARYPGAAWQPLADDWASQPRMRAFDIVCIHTMVGGLEGTDSLFRVNNGPGFVGTESHFGTSHDGRVVQWQDTAHQAEANYNGNGHIISIENADWGAPFPKWSGADVPAFTAAQVEAIAGICAWAHRVHGIPLELIPDSKPGRRGIAPHRWGVPGYVVAGGELWSTARGKACPGDRRIAQLPQIIARARQLAGGAQEDDMPLNDADKAAIKAIVYDTMTTFLVDTAPGKNANANGALMWIISDAVKPVAAALQGQIAGLAEALARTGDGEPIDLNAVRAAAKAGAEEALKEGVDVDVTVGGQRPGAA